MNIIIDLRRCLKSLSNILFLMEKIITKMDIEFIKIFFLILYIFFNIYQNKSYKYFIRQRINLSYQLKRTYKKMRKITICVEAE